MIVSRATSLMLLCLVLVGGCSSSRLLMPTPHLYTDGKAKLFGELVPELTRTQVELIYVTDRAPEADETGKLHYGFRRSGSISVGTTVVDLGENFTWAQLVKASLTNSRLGKFPLKLISTNEFARLPPTPMPYDIIDGKVVEVPEVVAEHDKNIARIR